jgi:hypothetical protein
VTADAETRAEVLAEIREVLALLKEQAARPAAPDPPRAVPQVPWETPPSAGPESDVLEALEAYRGARGARGAAPAGLTAGYAGPHAPLLGLLHRLAHLLGLSPLEQEFFTACASDGLPGAFDGRLAYADWLEERAFEEGALRMRKLTPQPGDVLVWSLAAVAGTGRYALDAHLAAAQLVRDRLAGRGVETSFVLLQQGVALDRLSAQQMAELGLVPAGRLARVRERCAALAEQGHYYHLAASIRADPSLEELQWAEVPAAGGTPA